MRERNGPSLCDIFVLGLNPRLPREIGMLSLHLSESTVPDLDRLLRGVENVKDLVLRGTPVEDPFAEEVVSHFALEYIDLVETQVTADCLRRLAKAHPTLRMHHHQCAVRLLDEPDSLPG